MTEVRLNKEYKNNEKRAESEILKQENIKI